MGGYKVQDYSLLPIATIGLIKITKPAEESSAYKNPLLMICLDWLIEVIEWMKN